MTIGKWADNVFKKTGPGKLGDRDLNGTRKDPVPEKSRAHKKHGINMKRKNIVFLRKEFEKRIEYFLVENRILFT